MRSDDARNFGVLESSEHYPIFANEERICYLAEKYPDVIYFEVEEFEVQAKYLEAILYNVEEEYPLEDVKFEAEYRPDFDTQKVRLSKAVWAEKLAEDYYTGKHIIETPKTTWQMFKATNQNKWWLRHFVKRRPVRCHNQPIEIRVKVERYLKYPELNAIPKSLGRPVRYETIIEV